MGIDRNTSHFNCADMTFYDLIKDSNILPAKATLADAGDIELFTSSSPMNHIASYWKVKDGQKQYMIISSQSEVSIEDAKTKLIENIRKAYDTFSKKVIA